MRGARRGWNPAALIGIVMIASVLAGCLAARDPIDTEPPIAERDLDSASLLSHLRNVSAPLPGLSLDTAILEQYRVPAPDGILLDTWIVRPDTPDPVPLVLEVTPYYGGGPPTFAVGDALDLGGWGLVPQVLVERGYAFGVSSVRGTGNSEGCFTQGGPGEGKDTAAVVEALAAEGWSNGNVGIIGVSYPGTTPKQVWLEAPPSLKTIVPISGISDFYKYNFKNGVPIWIQGYGFNTYYWPLTGPTPVGLSGGLGLLDPVSLPGKIIGGFGGIVVESHGYFLFFIYVALLGVPAILLVTWLLRRPPLPTPEVRPGDS
jgi:X-Pro dipeptidyl-peptidase